MLQIDVTMDHWLPDVKEEEHWDHWEKKSNPVPRESDVQDAISLQGGEWSPVSLISWFSAESNLLLS